MSKCNSCKYVIIGYCEYYVGLKEYFVDGCKKGMIAEEEPEECDEFEEVDTV